MILITMADCGRIWQPGGLSRQFPVTVIQFPIIANKIPVPTTGIRVQAIDRYDVLVEESEKIPVNSRIFGNFAASNQPRASP
jgi:hypothetical protein